MKNALKSRFAALATFSLALGFALGGFAEEGHGGESSESGAPPAPPQPRVVAPYPKPALPPRASDPSWERYQEGLKLYGQKRLGESIDAFKDAIEARTSLYSRCASDVDAAASAKEAKKAKDSLGELTRLLAARDLIPQDLAKIEAAASGSLVAEMRLLRATSPTPPLRGLIDATLLVVEEGGISKIGDSVASLRRQVRSLGFYPEAEFMIGKAYLAEGEVRLAELQFRKACDMAESLESPQDRYDMLMALAETYRTEGNAKSYEDTLREIAEASDLFAAKDDFYRGSMERTLGDRGFDKFMAMFRIEESYPVGAYAALGELYLGNGRSIATIYLAAAVNSLLTRSIAQIRLDEPSYEYTKLGELLSRIRSDRELARFASDMELWKALKLLGDSLAMSGYRDSAREIWSAIKGADAPQPWKRRATEALAKPVSAWSKL